MFFPCTDTPFKYVILVLVRHCDHLNHPDDVLSLFTTTFQIKDKQSRLTSYEHRFRMCELAFSDVPNVTVSDAEYRSWLHAVGGDSDNSRKTKYVYTA